MSDKHLLAERILIRRIVLALALWALAIFCGWRLQGNPTNGAWIAPAIGLTCAGLAHGAAAFAFYWERTSHE